MKGVDINEVFTRSSIRKDTKRILKIATINCSWSFSLNSFFFNSLIYYI